MYPAVNIFFAQHLRLTWQHCVNLLRVVVGKLQNCVASVWGSANKIVRLDTCSVSPYNIGRYVLTREKHVSPLKRTGNYTYRQVGHMKHCRSPNGAYVRVCPV